MGASEAASCSLLPAPCSRQPRPQTLDATRCTHHATANVARGAGQLLANLFAHSRNCFEEFVARPSNWFDTVIVIQSLVTVILLAAGVMEAPSGSLAPKP